MGCSVLGVVADRGAVHGRIRSDARRSVQRGAGGR
jgi:hypothetical protein